MPAALPGWASIRTSLAALAVAASALLTVPVRAASRDIRPTFRRFRPGLSTFASTARKVTAPTWPPGFRKRANFATPAKNILPQNVAIKADLSFGVYHAENARFENCTIATPEGVNRIVTTNAEVAIT